MTRNPLTWTAALLCLALIPCGWMVATATSSALGKVGLAADAIATAPQLLGDRVAAIQASVDALPAQILPPVLARVDTVTGKADSQLTALRGDVMTRVDKIETDANARTGEALGIVAAVRMDAQPVLANAAALVKDTQDSLDDSYWDGKALLESATLATTQAAQTMEHVRAIAPKFLATAQQSNVQFSGIATDVHAFTTKFTAPASTKTKVWEGFKTMTLIGARIL